MPNDPKFETREAWQTDNRALANRAVGSTRRQLNRRYAHVTATHAHLIEGDR